MRFSKLAILACGGGAGGMRGRRRTPRRADERADPRAAVRGRADVRELRRRRRPFAPPPMRSKTGMAREFARADANSDGSLQPIEFQNWAKSVLGGAQMGPYRLDFDRNVDNVITREEFDTEIRGRMRDYDENQDTVAHARRDGAPGWSGAPAGAPLRICRSMAQLTIFAACALCRDKRRTNHCCSVQCSGRSALPPTRSAS